MEKYNLYRVTIERANAIGVYNEIDYVVAKSVTDIDPEFPDAHRIECLEKDIKIMK